MSLAPRPWLPPGAVSHGRVDATLERALAHWSGHWFADAGASLEPLFQDDFPAPSSGSCWRSIDGFAALPLTPPAQAALAGAMLGVQVPQLAADRRDWPVVRDLARAAADDLLRRIGELISPTAHRGEIKDGFIDPEDCSWWKVSIGARRGAFNLALSAAALVGIVKRGFPAPAGLRLGGLAEGIAGQKIAVAAALGRSTLRLAELETMSIGDVVVLERSPASPVELLIDRKPSALRATLDAVGDQPVLIIEQGERSDD
jgi:Type III flagellar switch regulator (C-ring) FliN C-term